MRSLTGTRSDPNNNSLVLVATTGGFRVLLTGDAETEEQLSLLAADDPAALRADVLKVAHHGSRTSSTEPFLDMVHPAFALISAGFENSYGHPHATILERLEDRHAATLRTDRDGMITIRTDGQHLKVETYSGFFSQR